MKRKSIGVGRIADRWTRDANWLQDGYVHYHGWVQKHQIETEFRWPALTQPTVHDATETTPSPSGQGFDARRTTVGASSIPKNVGSITNRGNNAYCRPSTTRFCSQLGNWKRRSGGATLPEASIRTFSGALPMGIGVRRYVEKFVTRLPDLVETKTPLRFSLERLAADSEKEEHHRFPAARRTRSSAGMTAKPPTTQDSLMGRFGFPRASGEKFQFTKDYQGRKNSLPSGIDICNEMGRHCPPRHPTQGSVRREARDRFRRHYCRLDSASYERWLHFWQESEPRLQKLQTHAFAPRAPKSRQRRVPECDGRSEDNVEDHRHRRPWRHLFLKVASIVFDKVVLVRELI